jgi:hypothetical protein
LYSDFFSARDFLYLSGILLGAAIGLLFSFYKRSLTRGQKERRLTAGIYVLSAAFSAAAVSIVSSNGLLFYDSGLLTAALCVTAAGFLAVLLPEIFLLPLIVPAGICAALAACFFLRYPQTGNSIVLTRISLPARDTIIIEPEYPKFIPVNYYNIINSRSVRPHSQYRNYYNKERPFTLEYFALIVTINRLIPFIGGQQRCILTGLNLVDYSFLRLKLYDPPLLEETAVGALKDIPFINARIFSAQMELNDLEPYINYTIFFNGKTGSDASGEPPLYKLPPSSIAYAAN